MNVKYALKHFEILYLKEALMKTSPTPPDMEEEMGVMMYLPENLQT